MARWVKNKSMAGTSMKISILSSGSKGNSTYICTRNTNILIDIGVSCSSIEKKLKEIEVDPKNIDAIFITHTHIDHINGLRVFWKKYKPKIYLSQKMYEEIKEQKLCNDYQIIEKSLIVKDLIIDTIKTSHDVSESFGYILKEKDRSVVYITDTGYINNKHHDKLKNHDVYIMESNHDVEMLINGNRPHYIKQRILSDVGHLSNKQSSEYLAKFCGEKTKYIFLAHLSEDNNNESLAKSSLIEKLEKKHKVIDNIIVAKQNEKTELIEI